MARQEESPQVLDRHGSTIAEEKKQRREQQRQYREQQRQERQQQRQQQRQKRQQQRQRQRQESVNEDNLDQEASATTSLLPPTPLTWDENDLEERIDNEYLPIMNEEEGKEEETGNEAGDGFFSFILRSSGPPQIVFVCLLYALALGSTVGVVPSVMTDQYAHIYHGLDSNTTCATSTNEDTGTENGGGEGNRYQACLDGNTDAQSVTAVTHLVYNLVIFFTGSLIGSLSDEFGRRSVLLLGQFLSLLPTLCLILLQRFNTMNPIWYFIAYAASNLVSWFTIALCVISDVVPKKWRASCFGILLSGFSLGLGLAPTLALFLSHLGVSILSFSLLLCSFFYTLVFLPETLSKKTQLTAKSKRKEMTAALIASFENSGSSSDSTGIINNNVPDESNQNLHYCNFKQITIFIRIIIIRPFQELSIINRNMLLRILSTLAFFSGMSSSGDQTLLVYYVEQRLGFNDSDIALLFFMIGVPGIFIQGFILKRLIDCFGERMVIIFAFLCGATHNIAYAFASNKIGIFIGAIIGPYTLMAFPTISAIKANNVDEHEQGRIQGALYALSSLASALGPVSLRLAYQKTKDTIHPGAFFLVASAFYTIAMFCGVALPKEKSDSRYCNNDVPTTISTTADNEGDDNGNLAL